MSQYFFTLPFPPSVNTYWRKWNNRMVISEVGREYSGQVVPLIMAGMGAPLTGRLHVEIYLSRHDRRSYDVDNFNKCLLDCFTKAGFWNDDSQIDKLTITRMPVCKPGKCEILIRELPTDGHCKG